MVPKLPKSGIYIYIYIHILDITSRIHIHIWRPPGRLNGGSGGADAPPGIKTLIIITIPMNYKCPLYWAGLWLVKQIFYTVWVQIQWLEKIVYTSRFSVIFQNSQNCRQITATPRRSIFHAAKSLQMPYKAKNQKITYFHNKIKNPLELRHGPTLVATSKWTWPHVDTTWRWRRAFLRP